MRPSHSGAPPQVNSRYHCRSRYFVLRGFGNVSTERCGLVTASSRMIVNKCTALRARAYGPQPPPFDSWVHRIGPSLCTFKAFLPRILEDKGEVESMTDEDVVQREWEALADASCFWRRGSKTSLMRFGDVVKRGRRAIKEWHSQLFGILLYSLKSGLVSRVSMERLIQNKVAILGAVVGSPAQDDAPLSIGDGDRQLAQSFRSVVSNGLLSACLMYMDSNNLARQKIIVVAGEAVEAWRAEQAVELRSTEQNLAWVIKQLKGGYMAHIEETITTPFRYEALEACDFDFKIRPDVRDVNHPMVAEQDERAGLLVKYCMHLAGSRLVRGMWFTRGWPTRVAGFLDGAIGPGLIDQFKSDEKNFAALASKTGKVYRELQSRHIFNDVAVKQVLGVLKIYDYKRDEALLRWVHTRSMTIMSELICEEAFQRERSGEPDNYNMSAHAPWSILVKNKVFVWALIQEFRRCLWAVVPVRLGPMIKPKLQCMNAL